MKVLFDQGTPAPLRRALAGHSVSTAFELGWSNLRIGDLLDAAESRAFDVFVTTDQNLRYQQNLANRRIAIVVVLSTSWKQIQNCVDRIGVAVDQSTPGSYVEVPI